jgi:NAD(P)-dependent dehydrogenase (short-subunit alcohol dehydrogenase family)
VSDALPEVDPVAGRLAGRRALVTGAGQGIGRGVARALARAGAAVGLVGRTEASLRRVEAEIHLLGGRAVVAVADVGQRAQVDAAVRHVAGELGGLDVVVNNAQSFVFRPVEDLTDEDLSLTLSSGPIGTLHVMQAALPWLREGGGVVVNFATSSGLTGEANFGAYAMAKEAIRGLTRVAATEWGPLGIRANCVCPTAASPAIAAWIEANPERAAEMEAARPLRRMGDPEEDIGRAVVAVASDDLSYLTGATLMLNGGRVYL